MLLSPNCQTKGAPRAPIRVAVSYPSAHASSLEAPRLQCTGVHPLWNPLSSSKKHAALFRPRPVNQPRSSPSSHSVPSMQVQVLLTCLSAFFSTFLRSTFPLSVFMSYLDLAEIYQLLYAEITINVTLKEGKI